MRFLEILLPIFLVIYFFWPLIKGRRVPAINILPTFTIVLLINHYTIEGWRWQMIPLYIITIFTFLVTLPNFLKKKGEDVDSAPRPSWYQTLGLVLLLAFSVALPALLPVPSIPRPDGPFSVGTTTFELTDPTRAELYAESDSLRRLMIQTWYPADPGPDDKPAPWMESAELFAPALADFISMPSWFLDHLAYAKTNSYKDAPPNSTGGPYPLIVFSHGWRGFREQNTFQMQELASHGYVVVSIQHTYGAILTVFPDGTIAPNNPSALPGGVPEDEYDAAARKLVNQWAQDIGYTLDTFAKLNENDPSGLFTSLLDLERVGLMGHSTGGGAVVQFCATDPRCKAGLAMDAFMTPVSEFALENGAQQPFLFLFSQDWADKIDSKNNRLFARFYPNLSEPAPVIAILGTNHYDFSDLPALSPLAPQLGLKGPLNGARVQEIINNYTLAFFDLQFKNIPSVLFNGNNSDYPEMRYEQP
jgi:predicted dienelactone hydrolase